MCLGGCIHPAWSIACATAQKGLRALHIACVTVLYVAAHQQPATDALLVLSLELPFVLLFMGALL